MFQFSKRQKIWLITGILSFVTFVVFTLIVAFVDVNQVGLSHFNQFFLQRCGQNGVWEWVTDIIGYCLILVLLCLLICQIVQWVRRKSLFRVDRNLLLLDVICCCLVVVYIFFEIIVVNYRPLLENGKAEASYPSSHAMLFTTLLPLLIWQVWYYIKSKSWRIVLTVILVCVLFVGLVGRLLSGVHWFTDILAGIIMSGAFNSLYMCLSKK